MLLDTGENIPTNVIDILKWKTTLHPSPKVMADFFRHKNQHPAFIQFAQFLVDLLNVC